MRREIRHHAEAEAEPKGSAMRDALIAHEEEAGELAVLRAVPDLRGLPVEDAGGLSVGRLWGALAEAETGLLRYLDLDLSTSDRHVLIPIGHARVRRSDEAGRIHLRAALREQLEDIPPLPAEIGHIDDPFERALLEAYGRTFLGERYYAHPSYDHSGIYAGDHPVIGDSDSDADQLMRLAYLPGWRVARGEPDIRGWPLRLEGDGERLQIRDLVVDPAAGRVRYVVLETPAGGARLLPIGFIGIDESRDSARAAGLTLEDIDSLPPYTGGGVSRSLEERIHGALRLRLTGRRRYLLPDFRGDDVSASPG